jgi:hypothetical protein
MMFVQDVPVGAIIFLECGCRGHRMMARPEAPTIAVIVDHPCGVHGPDRHPFMREIEALTTVSPFTRSSETD